MLRVIATSLIALAAPVAADQGGDPDAAAPVVVELFTSQGCSACPSADAILAELADRDDVIALALHVDYWDYIGWEDPFAEPAYTERQKAYAREAGERMLYTPQMIVQGEHRVVGTRPGALAHAIMDEAGRTDGTRLAVERSGGQIAVRAAAEGPFDPPLVVHLVRFDPELRSTAVTHGENAGHTLKHTHVVTGWEAVGRWDGKAPLEETLDAPGEALAVVILQEPGPGRVIAAAVVP